MTLTFDKYQGTGNDFIILDDRDARFPDQNTELVARLCHRRFGIGADGLILVRPAEGADFTMLYFNADGKPGSMCGNGGRCVAAFAKDRGLVSPEHTQFLAFDGPHEAWFEQGLVRLKMGEVGEIKSIGEDWFVNTGSPHYVREVTALDTLDVEREGAFIRNSPLFAPGGTNVNFIERGGEALRIRTFERGVEGETLSCGTGNVAAALVAAQNWGYSSPVRLHTQGGDLEVHFQQEKGHFYDIWLQGPAQFVFSGQIHLA